VLDKRQVSQESRETTYMKNWTDRHGALEAPWLPLNDRKLLATMRRETGTATIIPSWWQPVSPASLCKVDF
jgi:hypothetical protein